ncbi:hypothetical protein Psp6_00027 [Pseudomonas phage Psp6]|nr:hypothetical protein Psp6_00027 [Pseudomonas phage Psp6]
MAEQVTMWRDKQGKLHETEEEAVRADGRHFLEQLFVQFWRDGEFDQDAAVEFMLDNLKISVKP